MPGPLRVAAAAEHLSELGDQGRPAVRGRRVDDEAGRLVDDGEVVVEVDDAGLERSPARSSRRKIRAKTATPTVIATSARLKGGQEPISM